MEHKYHKKQKSQSMLHKIKNWVRSSNRSLSISESDLVTYREKIGRIDEEIDVLHRQAKDRLTIVMDARMKLDDLK
jgi:hypothetical protein